MGAPASLRGRARAARSLIRGRAASGQRSAPLGPPPGASGGRPAAQQVVRFKQSGTTGEVEEELEYVRLEFDVTELLDLHGRDSYLFCDITRAYDHLLGSPLPEGYTAEVVEGRRQLLDFAKEQALYHEGRVATSGKKGTELPVQLLPAALALLAQINQNVVVFDLAGKLLDNWDMRKVHKRDLVLSLAVAHCNVARELLADQKVADGCAVLEEAAALLQGAGEPPLAPALSADIREAVDGMAVQRILDQLRGPMGGDAAPARRTAVGMLRELLAAGSAARRRGPLGRGVLGAPLAGGAGDCSAAAAAAGGVTPDYVRLVVDCMASHELVAMANWEQAARSPSSATWLYPGLLQIAATAHLATGFRERSPATIKAGLALLRAAPSSCEVLLLRGVGSMLLGQPEAAVGLIKAAASAPPDQFISWPEDTSGPTGSGEAEAEEGVVAATRLPAGRDAYGFLAAHSGADEPELLSGLCLFTEVFLTKVVFAGFPDTSALAGASCSLPGYFDNPRVQQELQDEQERSAGLAGSLSRVMEAVMSVRPLVQQVADSARSAGSQLGLRLKDAAAPGAAVGGGGGAIGRLAADGAGAAASAADGGAAAEDEAAGALAGAAPSVADRLANKLSALRWALMEGQPGGRWPAAAAGAAALAAVAVGVALARRGAAGAPATATPPPQQQQRQAAAREAAPAPLSAAAAARPLDKAAALRLVKSFQAAKAAALGSSFDASQLPSVAVGPALSRFSAQSADWASRGWFRASTLWKADVQRIERRGGGAGRATVFARIGETANSWGVDGQAGASWSNEYDVEYDVVLCGDLRWRIQGVTVRGREPGMPRWPGARLLGGLLGGK